MGAAAFTQTSAKGLRAVGVGSGTDPGFEAELSIPFGRSINGIIYLGLIVCVGSYLCLIESGREMIFLGLRAVMFYLVRGEGGRDSMIERRTRHAAERTIRPP